MNKVNKEHEWFNSGILDGGWVLIRNIFIFFAFMAAIGSFTNPDRQANKEKSDYVCQRFGCHEILR